MSEYQTFSKPLGQRVVELLQSLQVIRDCIAASNGGRRYMLIPLFGQLRALVAEKSRANQPLLCDLAAKFGVPLKVYSMPGIDDDGFPDSLKQNLLLRVSGLPVSRLKTESHQKEFLLDEFLSHSMVVYKDRKYSSRDLIKALAEKSGGAHFPEKIPVEYSELMAFAINGEPMLYNALLQVAEAIYDLGVSFIQRLSTIQLHVVVVIPQQHLAKAAYLFEATNPYTPMRFGATIEPGLRVGLGAVGIDGMSSAVRTERLVDWTKARHLAFRHEIQPDLSTKLGIDVDGEPVATTRTRYPIFISSDLAQFHRFQNRSKDDPTASAALGLVELVGIGSSTKEEDRGLREYLAAGQKQPQQSCVFFPRGTYGETLPGNRDMTVVGDARRWTVDALLEGRFPEIATLEP